MNYNHEKNNNKEKKRYKHRNNKYSGYSYKHKKNKGFSKPKKTGHYNNKNQYIYKKKKRDIQKEIYKQDLIQRGFEVFQRKKLKNEEKIQILIDEFPRCFNRDKRKVVIDLFMDDIREESQSHQSGLKLDLKSELQQEYGNLIENEDIPEWFIDDKPRKSKQGDDFAFNGNFNFADLINRTKDLNKEKIIQKNKLQENQEDENLLNNDDIKIDFEELDRILEKEAQHKKQIIKQEQEFYEMQSDLSNESFHSQDHKDQSQESADYFQNLENNIKNLMFNQSEGEESEESFQETIGFNYNPYSNTETPNKSQLDQTQQSQNKSSQQPSQIESLQSKLNTFQQNLYEQNQQQHQLNQITKEINKNQRIDTNQPQNPNQIQGQQLNDNSQAQQQVPQEKNLSKKPELTQQEKEEKEEKIKQAQLKRLQKQLISKNNEEVAKSKLVQYFQNFDLDKYLEEQAKKITPEEKEARTQSFKQKYGYLDPILCQIVYEILNSKQRLTLNKFSMNGFNQNSVQKYCSNPYKIFSLYLQGDIISKVWLYKDKLNNIQGPFMSYDMDIWNGEDNYFAKDIQISLMNNIFLPIKMYQDRDPLIIEIINAFLLKRSNEFMELQKQKITKKQRRYNKKKQYKPRQMQTDAPMPLQKKPVNFEEKFPTFQDVQKESYSNPLIAMLKTNNDSKVQKWDKESVQNLNFNKNKSQTQDQPIIQKETQNTLDLKKKEIEERQKQLEKMMNLNQTSFKSHANPMPPFHFQKNFNPKKAPMNLQNQIRDLPFSKEQSLISQLKVSTTQVQPIVQKKEIVQPQPLVQKQTQEVQQKVPNKKIKFVEKTKSESELNNIDNKPINIELTQNLKNMLGIQTNIQLILFD